MLKETTTPQTAVQNGTSALEQFESFDYFGLDAFMTDKQKALRAKVQRFMEKEVKPHINEYWEKAEFPMDVFLKLRELPIMGGFLRGYECAGLDPLEIGLVMYEMTRVDGSFATAYGVHSGLAMGSIGLLGSDEQRQKWLPPMARMEKIGAFGLTEPDRGSDAAQVQTTAVRDGDEIVLNGAKRWIGNAAFADILIIWARDEEGGMGGFIIEDPQNTPGVTIKNIQGKIGKRALLNADITLEDVRIPAENRLAKSKSFRDTAKVLAVTRYGVAWDAAGVAAGAFEAALKYTKEREQFGKPIAQYQLIQQKLVEMATELTHIQLMCFQLANLMATNQLDEGKAAMAKYSCARKARRITQLAREAMGGNGLLIENDVARLMTDAEVVYTYEGTNEINMLIVGRDITGLSAFV